ncbi:MAG: DASH family cryptochrome [Saprospiraceae bacterium]|nr:DASH family cryptochrome [Saprospiraceae bacterium]
MDNIAIVWFRNDLRLHDNEMLTDAIQKAKFVLPLYVFDPGIFTGTTSFGFEKTAKFRTKFILESVEDLRKQLRLKGSDLIIRIGKPEEEIFIIAKEYKSSWVYCNRERTDEEVKVQDRVEKKLWTIGQELRFCRGKMLYYTADLPFPISQVPDTFSGYRKEIEYSVPLRKPLPVPEAIPFPDFKDDRGVLPTLADFSKGDLPADHIENQNFKGGETEGLKHLNHFVWETNQIASYKDTRNQLLGWSFSTKLSAWLSTGCLSPKYVIEQKLKFEEKVIKNESTYWLYFELLWRDYFRLMGKKYENRIFQPRGISHHDPGGSVDYALFGLWATGMTGVPFIDANMRQLNSTGFMSNRGRQNVASFLVKDLNIKWLMGAEYFESLLLDYDPCSNYGNWNHIAGVGNDAKDDKYYNILAQSRKYDPEGKFIKYWIPELRPIPAHMVHDPGMMNQEDQHKYGVILGKDYPMAVTTKASRLKIEKTG